ncbi:MAG: EamA family transporter [Rhodospirillaceae bacterium]|nr:EamA family transporter [Rhodospirillaceae bacterium]
MTASSAPSNNLGGIYAILAGMVVITLQDTSVKWLSPDYALHQIMLSRGVLALCITFWILRLEGGVHLLRTRRLHWHLCRALLMVIANMAFFLAVAAMPLAEAIAIFFVAPLFITIFSIPFLGERVGPRRWAAVLVGLAGVVVMLRPGFSGFDWITLLPIVAAFSYASLQMLARKLGATDKASTMSFYIQATLILVSSLIGLTVGDGRFSGTGNTSLDFLFRAWRWPETEDIWLFIWCGISSGFGSYLLSQAYRLGEATVVAPFEYVALPMAALCGFLLWGDIPTLRSVLGMTLILSAGLYILYRENVRGRSIVTKRPMPRNR